jgi:hypothetical protein
VYFYARSLSTRTAGSDRQHGGDCALDITAGTPPRKVTPQLFKMYRLAPCSVRVECAPKKCREAKIEGGEAGGVAPHESDPIRGGGRWKK